LHRWRFSVGYWGNQAIRIRAAGIWGKVEPRRMSADFIVATRRANSAVGGISVVCISRRYVKRDAAIL